MESTVYFRRWNFEAGRKYVPETYLVAGAFDSKEEATNYMDYLKTQFVRFLILQIAMTQQLSKASFAFVPCQEFYKKMDRQTTV
ncbi:MAG: hypothetical protein ACLSTW_07625 [Faecalibacterium sp.]